MITCLALSAIRQTLMSLNHAVCLKNLSSPELASFSNLVKTTGKTSFSTYVSETGKCSYCILSEKDDKYWKCTMFTWHHPVNLQLT